MARSILLSVCGEEPLGKIVRSTNTLICAGFVLVHYIDAQRSVTLRNAAQPKGLPAEEDVGDAGRDLNRLESQPQIC